MRSETDQAGEHQDEGAQQESVETDTDLTGRAQRSVMHAPMAVGGQSRHCVFRLVR